MTTTAELPDPHQDIFSRNILGFWIYLMSDCILFATLFATYAILHTSTFGGPGPRELFDLNTTIAETIILLFSSITCGFGVLAATRSKKNKLLFWFALSFLLGASFVALELHEFKGLLDAGHSWKNSAFLSSFFTLVGTHGFHVSVGLLWMITLMLQIVFQGIQIETFRRIVCFSMFWHFLDLVWIFIFTFVYLIGSISS